MPPREQWNSSLRCCVVQKTVIDAYESSHIQTGVEGAVTLNTTTDLCLVIHETPLGIAMRYGRRGRKPGQEMADGRFLRRCVVLVVATVMMFGAFGAVGIGSTRAATLGQSTQPCTAAAISAKEYSVGSEVNRTEAIRTALAYAAGVAATGVTGWLVGGTELNFSLDDSTCSLAVVGVSVLLLPQGSASSDQLVVSEVPALSSVAYVTQQPNSNLTASGAEWSGFEFSIPSGTSETYSMWVVPSITGNEGNHCGGGFYTWGYCEFAIWSGDTDSPGGSFGIAQAGLQLQLACEWTFFGWNCQSSYEEWYEFWPVDPYEINIRGVSPGDGTQIVTYWNATSGLYSIEANDYTKGQYTMVIGPSGFMGAPTYAEYESEDQISGSGNYVIPDFSAFTYSMAVPLGHTYACGINCLLNLHYTNYNMISVVDQTGLFYGSSSTPPGGIPGECRVYTCFTQSYA